MNRSFACAYHRHPRTYILLLFLLFHTQPDGIVPYVDPPNTGSIAGIIGAGGNSGAVGFGLGFRQLDVKKAFMLMGFTIIGTPILSLGIFLPGHADLIAGQDDPTKQNIRNATIAKAPVDEEDADVTQRGGEEEPEEMESERIEA